MSQIEVQDQIRVRLFISYAHEDLLYLNQMIRFVNEKKLLRTTVWFDKKIESGSTWNSEIRENIRQADIVILLLSVDFFNSEYIMTKELPLILERYKSGKCKIIPVYTKPFDHDSCPSPYKGLAAVDVRSDIQGFVQPLSLEDAAGKRELIYLEIFNFLRTEIKNKLRNKIIGMSKKDDAAKTIQRLNARTNVFLCIPKSAELRAKRTEFIRHVIEATKNKEFGYSIVPSEDKVDELYSAMDAYNGKAEDYPTFINDLLGAYINTSFCSIFLRGSSLSAHEEAQENLLQDPAGGKLLWKLIGQEDEDVGNTRIVIGNSVNVFEELFEEIKNYHLSIKKRVSALTDKFLKKNVLVIQALQYAMDPELLTLIQYIKSNPLCIAEVISKYHEDPLPNSQGDLLFYKSQKDKQWLTIRQKDFVNRPYRGIYFSDPWSEKAADIDDIQRALGGKIIRGVAEMPQSIDEFLIDAVINNYRNGIQPN